MIELKYTAGNRGKYLREVLKVAGYKLSYSQYDYIDLLADGYDRGLTHAQILKENRKTRQSAYNTEQRIIQRLRTAITEDKDIRKDMIEITRKYRNRNGAK